MIQGTLQTRNRLIGSPPNQKLTFTNGKKFEKLMEHSLKALKEL